MHAGISGRTPADRAVTVTNLLIVAVEVTPRVCRHHNGQDAADRTVTEKTWEWFRRWCTGTMLAAIGLTTFAQFEWLRCPFDLLGTPDQNGLHVYAPRIQPDLWSVLPDMIVDELEAGRGV
jgi:hypothetical protein